MYTTTCPKCGAQLIVEDPTEEYIVCEYCGSRVYFHYDRNFQADFGRYSQPDPFTDFFAAPFREYRARKHAEDERRQREADDAERQWQQAETQRREQQAHQTEQDRAFREEESAKRARKACARKHTFQSAISYCKANPTHCITGAIAVLVLVIGLGIWIPREAKRRDEISAHQTELKKLEQEQIAYSHQAQGEAQIPEIPGLKQDITKIKIDMIDYRIVKRAFTDAGFTNVTTETQEYAHGWNNLVYEVTVDGVPQLHVGEWLPVDTPIIISYYTYGADTSSSSVPTTWDEITNNAIGKINDLADSAYQGLDSLAEKYGASISRPEN